jgi:hypothetical protein
MVLNLLEGGLDGDLTSLKSTGTSSLVAGRGWTPVGHQFLQPETEKDANLTQSCNKEADTSVFTWMRHTKGQVGQGVQF